MNILFFSHYLTLYGANRSLLTLLEGLVENGYNCYVIVPGKGSLTDELDKLQIKYKICGLPWWVSSNNNSGNLINSASKIYRWIKREIFAIYKLKYLVKAWKIDLIYSNSSVISTGFILAKLTNKPHIWHLREYSTLDYSLFPFIGISLFKKVINSSTGIICVSHSIKRYFNAMNHDKAPVIYNGVANASMILDSSKIRRSTTPRFTFSIIGLVAPLKGQEEAIRALSLVVKGWPNTILNIVGEGAVTELESLVTQLNLQNNVNFLGYSDNVFQVLKNTNALLMCSRNEAMGRVTAEAMCSGVPVIGYDAGGTSELIDHGINGVLYKDNYYSLGESMIKLLEDQEFYYLLSRKALLKAEKLFSIEVYINSVSSLIKELLAKRT